MLTKNGGVYTVAAHHFCELIPGEKCINKSPHECTGISSLTELMSYTRAGLLKLNDINVSHYGVLTETEKQQCIDALAIYDANVARGGSH